MLENGSIVCLFIGLEGKQEKRLIFFCSYFAATLKSGVHELLTSMAFGCKLHYMTHYSTDMDKEFASRQTLKSKISCSSSSLTSTVPSQVSMTSLCPLG